jgi:Flp pilus assembly protein TadG
MQGQIKTRAVLLRLFTRACSLLARFHGDRKGATAIEFAMVSVPFTGLLFAIFETAFIFFTAQGLEAAVANASRQILTGQLQSNNLTDASAVKEALRNLICPTSGARVLPSYVDCSKLIMDVQLAASFSSPTINMSNSFYANSTQNYCMGKARDIVIVRVIYPMPVYFSVLAGTTTSDIHQVTAGLVNDVPGNSGWKHLLMATAVFQTEPYTGTYNSPTKCAA